MKGYHQVHFKEKHDRICWGKLHFTTQNYILDYALHQKLFECKFCTINYDIYYTLHIDINFTCFFLKR